MSMAGAGPPWEWGEGWFMAAGRGIPFMRDIGGKAIREFGHQRDG